MADVTTGSAPRPWRRYLRFSMRGLIVVVLLIGGWIGWIVRSARVQRDAVAAIKRAGGTALYDWQWHFPSRGPARNASGPWAPIWLVERIGADYFQNVTNVSLRDSGSSSALVAQIGGFDRLELLMLGGSEISDDALRHLNGLSNLQALHLSGTDVTDRGLKHLKGSVRLKRLSLQGAKVTDSGMVHLQRLTSLEELDLKMTQITDSGLISLRELKNLRRLNLEMTRISDAGLIHLRCLSNLQKLRLRNAKIVKNSSLEHLREALPKVEIDY
jgi:hypothetical protein